MSVSFCLPHPVAVSAFMICRGLCACTEMLWKGDLFVLSWARVRQVRQGNISSELLMYGGGVHSILLLSLVARCLETIYVCIWCMFVFMSVVVTVWGSVGIRACQIWQFCLSWVSGI